MVVIENGLFSGSGRFWGGISGNSASNKCKDSSHRAQDDLGLEIRGEFGKTLEYEMH